MSSTFGSPPPSSTVSSMHNLSYAHGGGGSKTSPLFSRTSPRPAPSRTLYLLLHIALCSVILLYAVVCPFTKVEESFNVQAVHDIMAFGIDRRQISTVYDHKAFPGVVPRTFVGPLLLAPLARIATAVLMQLRMGGDRVRLLGVRVALGAVGAAALSFFVSGIALALGHYSASCAASLLLTQFHYLYYLSRPLPNTFASIACLLVFGLFLRRRNLEGLALLAASGTLFRSELLLLVLVNMAMHAGFKLGNVGTSARVVCLSIVLSVALSLAVDTYFWGSMSVPEWSVFRYNIIEGRSSIYGVAPWHYYLTSALPKSIPVSLVLCICGTLLRVPGWKMGLPTCLYLAVFSMVKHKELRFLFPVFPVFSLIAGSFENSLYHIALSSYVRLLTCVSRRTRNPLLHNCVFYLKALAQMALALTTVARAYVSSWNYPGGFLLHELPKHIPPSLPAVIYIDNFAAQTGFSRFIEDAFPMWRFDRTDSISNVADFSALTHVVTEPGNFDALPGGFEIVGKVDAFDGFEWHPVDEILREAKLLQLRLPFYMKISPKLYILQRTEAHYPAGSGHVSLEQGSQSEEPTIISTREKEGETERIEPSHTLIVIPSEDVFIDKPAADEQTAWPTAAAETHPTSKSDDVAAEESSTDFTNAAPIVSIDETQREAFSREPAADADTNSRLSDDMAAPATGKGLGLTLSPSTTDRPLMEHPISRPVQEAEPPAPPVGNDDPFPSESALLSEYDDEFEDIEDEL